MMRLGRRPTSKGIIRPPQGCFEEAVQKRGRVEPEQLGQLIDTQAAALALYARQWCGVPDDVVQDAFLKLAMQQPAPDEPVAWLYRVVRNAAISAGRSARRRRRHEAAAAVRIPTWFVSDENRLDAETATAALLELSDDQRECIVAHLWGGLTFAQIAEVIGSSSSSAHRFYLAGLARLRERLGVQCPTRVTTRR